MPHRHGVLIHTTALGKFCRGAQGSVLVTVDPHVEPAVAAVATMSDRPHGRHLDFFEHPRKGLVDEIG